MVNSFVRKAQFAVLAGFVVLFSPALLAAQSAQELYDQAQEIYRGRADETALPAALELFQQAAEGGENASYQRIGVIQLELGNFNEALAALEIAVDRGSKSSIVTLAQGHATGAFGPLSDQSKGVPVLEELAQLETGERAAFALANLLWEGDAMAMDKARAVNIYRNLADRGYARALRTMGRLHLRGNNPEFVAKDLTRAIALLQEAVNKGSAWALRDLGAAYIETQNYEDAELALSTAVQLEVSGASADLANAHYRSLLGPLSDPSKGRAELKQLAEMGDVGAARYALKHYERRSRRINELDVDLVVANLWQATEAGDGGAARVLARFYRNLSWMMTDEREQVAKLVRDHGDILGAQSLAAETISVLYDRNDHRGSQARVTDYLDNLSEPGYAQALLRLRSIEIQAYVRVLQTSLRDLGYYEGRVSGLASDLTIKAIRRFCQDEGIDETCKHGPVAFQSSRLIAEALEEKRG
jgi:TPR repeat protein